MDDAAVVRVVSGLLFLGFLCWLALRRPARTLRPAVVIAHPSRMAAVGIAPSMATAAPAVGVAEPPPSLPAAAVRPLQVGRGIYRSTHYDESEEDQAFTRVFEDSFADVLNHGYYTTIAGTSHRNDDRTSRRRVIRECERGELLFLVSEPENPYDVNAVRICRKNGDQLGYVPARSAQEMKGWERRGFLWLAIFRRPTISPETGKVAGAVVLLLCVHPKLDGDSEPDEVSQAQSA